MAWTNTFANSKAFVGGRPIGLVELCATSAPYVSVTYACLVDTGADWLQLPDAAAFKAGVNLAAGTPLTLGTAGGGGVAGTLVRGVSLKIEGKGIITAVFFVPGGAALLGRSGLLAAYDLGMQTADWHW
jgi:predicted aspartyl protease